MVKVKLNNKYPNDFVTTVNGLVFYKKDNSLGKEENSHDVSLDNLEISNLLQQKILVIDDKEYNKHNGDDALKTITENTPANKIDNKLKIEVQEKEVQVNIEDEEIIEADLPPKQ